MTSRRHSLFRFSTWRAGEVVGLALVLLAALVPSAIWPELLRTVPAPPEASLDLGGLLFRLSLGALGAFILTGCMLDIWRPTPMEGAGSRPGSIRPATVGLLSVILLVSALLRLYALDRGGLWLDEIVTLVNYARRPFGDILTTFPNQNQHLLYSLSSHLSILVLGESEWALRFPAALFGTGSLLALFLVGRRVTTDAESLIAVAILAFSYHHIWFSQNARGYTALLFWALLASWLFLRALVEPRRRLWLYYACVVALGMFTHLTMVFVVAAQFMMFVGVAVVRHAKKRPYTLVPIGAGFVMSALLTFQLHALVVPQIMGPIVRESTTVGSWNSPLWTLSEMIRGLHLDAGVWLTVPVALAIVGAGCVSYLSRQVAVPLLLVFPAALLSAVMISMGHPLWPRFFVFLAGFGVLVVVRGIRDISERLCGVLGWTRSTGVRFGARVTVCLAIASAFLAPSAYGPKQDFAHAKEIVAKARQPGEDVVTVGLARLVYPPYYAPDWRVAETVDEVRSIRDKSSRLWLVYTFPVHMESDYPEILKLVQEEFEPMGRFDGSLAGGGVFVYRSHGGGVKLGS